MATARDRTRIACVRTVPYALWQAGRGHAGWPVAVVNGRGQVLHANEEAQGRGVVERMRLNAALYRCPELHHVPHSAPQLAAAWEGFLGTLYGYSPRVHAPEQGVAFLTVTEAAARELAAALDVQVGLADCQELAQLAAWQASSGEVRVIGAGAAEGAALSALPIECLAAAGLMSKILDHLRFLGLRHVGDLLRWSPAQQRAVLGVEFPRLKPSLHGPRTTSVPLYRPSPDVSASLAFDEPLSEPRDLDPALRQLALTLHERLNGQQPQRLTLRAESVGLSHEATREVKEALLSLPQLARLAGLALHDTGAAPLGLDRLTLVAGGLRRPARQIGLWDVERAKNAAEAVLRRFPTVLVEVAWRDEFAYASDLQYTWVEVSSGVERPLANAPLPVVAPPVLKQSLPSARAFFEAAR